MRKVWMCLSVLILFMLLVCGCEKKSSQANLLSPENLIQNALGKTDAQVEEALGITLEWPDRAENPLETNPTLACSVPFGDQVADSVTLEFQYGKGTPMTSFYYQFSSLETPEEYWDFLKEMAEQSRREGLESAMEEYYGQTFPYTFEEFDTYADFQAELEEHRNRGSWDRPFDGVEERFFATKDVYLIYTIRYSMGVPRVMGLGYVVRELPDVSKVERD